MTSLHLISGAISVRKHADIGGGGVEPDCDKILGGIEATGQISQSLKSKQGCRNVEIARIKADGHRL